MLQGQYATTRPTFITTAATITGTFICCCSRSATSVTPADTITTTATTERAPITAETHITALTAAFNRAADKSYCLIL